ncbi:hypothetical protein [Pseudomonas japonica]|uniref:hypothetical protein n=1 Tax=Pseudomonas japonica TaxID=256466 RepID=UPI0015E2C639|nr:hypothetical protein [Pseudomonas japonica]MBA1242651.1 hypothetical protein [Pseudomonas japonica]MBA1289118.1 hypothetical protein [Pseudomonas japonica]
MTVWIVVSILAVILSPLAWLRPSRKQSGRMACRMKARALGLGMQLAPQQWPHWMPAHLPTPAAQYHRPRPSPVGADWTWWQPEPGQWVNQWREPCTDAALLEQLNLLPADVWKVEAQRRMVSAVWGEGGGEGQAEAIDRALRTLATR